VVSSGGSSGGRRLCLQPLVNLDRSAVATAYWLRACGIDPAAALLVNPLPVHHVSGLMPWWRARCWGAQHVRLEPGLMKTPEALLAAGRSWPEGPRLLSLVPTQLKRLLDHPAGLEWLQGFDLIWVGGAALHGDLAERARGAGVPLAPCYGSTETAAMVAALPPQRFLAGETGCGDALPDVQWRLASDGGLELRTPRIALGCWQPEQPDCLQRLTDAAGWWRSGDCARLTPGLQILGRLDTAIHSGGETVFPEQLEQRLQVAMHSVGLSVDAVLLLAIPDPEWGERLVALVKAEDSRVLEAVQRLTQTWPPAERPQRWLLCPDLVQTEAGKLQRQRWRHWLERLDAANASGL
jgi:O-succinylbenzoic acid--CoA ligase